jgi:hypothetical protein
MLHCDAALPVAAAVALVSPRRRRRHYQHAMFLLLLFHALYADERAIFFDALIDSEFQISDMIIGQYMLKNYLTF